MPLRHWLRAATPRTTLVCLPPSTSHSARPLRHKRYVSSTPPTASSMSIPISPAIPSLKKTWSWLFPEPTSACECPTHTIPRQKQTSKEQKTYARHRERLHRALVDHFHEIEQLYRGNVEYVRSMGEQNPGLLEDLAFEGQRPPFMLIDCSDSRVNEQGIFNAQPGTMFTAGNIANMFDETDMNSNAVLAYAVGTLGVKHVVVLGHYGCGGVAASMTPLPDGWETHVNGETASNVASITEGSEVACPPPAASDLAVQKWIQPIRHIYNTSERWEIRAHRERAERWRKNGINNGQSKKPLHMHDPAFRALVEENVKANVKRVAVSRVIKDHYDALSKTTPPPPPPAALGATIPRPPPTSTSIPTDTPEAATTGPTSKPSLNPVYIHGWVYDLETGVVSDLGVSVGPPGWSTPRTYSE
ncbi:carbonic anhydrase [Coprinopsis cinerea AmutBmut pab1-1]|nr:carbonic anhydrase [Coprinopsis cinerea AmutBmut pab1-1]